MLPVAADYSVQDDGLTACTGSADEICHGDWYLPSKHELNLLYQQAGVVGGFAFDGYWSSTELVANTVWFQFFGNGAQGINDTGNTSSVRAVRGF